MIKVCCILICCMTAGSFSCYAQSDFSRFKDVKKNGKYYYSEADGNDTAALKVVTKETLINKVSIGYLDNTAHSSADSAISIAGINYLCLRYGLSYKVVAFVAIDSVVINRKKQKKGINIVAVTTPQSAKPATRNSIDELTGDKKVIVNELLQFTSVVEIQKYISQQARKNMLAYGTRESAVLNANDCYVVVTDIQQDKVLTVLSNDIDRVNLFTNVVVTDYKKEFPKANFIWVYVF